MQTKRLYIPFLLFCLLASAFLPIFQVQGQADTFEVSVSCDEKMRLRGQTVNITTLMNASSFRQVILGPSNQTLYDQIRTTNMSFQVPSNAAYGTYTIRSLVNGQVAETWLTVLDISGWQAASFPYNRTWQNVAYSFHSNGTINAQLTTTNDTMSIDLSLLRTLAVQYNLDVSPSQNSMNFRVRFSRINPTITIDLTFSFIHSGCKFTANGTLDQARQFTFEFENWQTRIRKALETLRNGDLVFDYGDLHKAGYAFSYSNGVLTVNVPQSFMLDPEIFSDGFESGNFSAWTGTSVSASCSATVVTDNPHHGSYNAKFLTAATGGWVNAKAYNTTAAYAELYLGGQVYVNSSSSAIRGILGFGDSIEQEIMRLGLSSADNLTLRYRSGASVTEITSATRLTEDTYYWIEIYCKVDGVTGTFTVWLDGDNVTDLYRTGIDSDGVGNIDRFDVGVWSVYNAAVDIQIDCVIASDAYIGPEGEEEPVSESFTLSQTVTITSALATQKNLYRSFTQTVIIEDDFYSIKWLTVTTSGTVTHTTIFSGSKSITAVVAEILETATLDASLSTIKWLTMILSGTVTHTTIMSGEKSITAVIAEILETAQLTASLAAQKAIRTILSGTVTVTSTLDLVKNLHALLVEIMETAIINSVLYVVFSVSSTVEDAIGLAAVALFIALVAFALVIMRRRN